MPPENIIAPLCMREQVGKKRQKNRPVLQKDKHKLYEKISLSSQRNKSSTQHNLVYMHGRGPSKASGRDVVMCLRLFYFVVSVVEGRISVIRSRACIGVSECLCTQFSVRCPVLMRFGMTRNRYPVH